MDGEGLTRKDTCAFMVDAWDGVVDGSVVLIFPMVTEFAQSASKMVRRRG